MDTLDDPVTRFLYDAVDLVEATLRIFEADDHRHPAVIARHPAHVQHFVTHGFNLLKLNELLTTDTELKALLLEVLYRPGLVLRQHFGQHLAWAHFLGNGVQSLRLSSVVM